MASSLICLLAVRTTPGVPALAEGEKINMATELREEGLEKAQVGRSLGGSVTKGERTWLKSIVGWHTLQLVRLYIPYTNNMVENIRNNKIRLVVTCPF